MDQRLEVFSSFSSAVDPMGALALVESFSELIYLIGGPAAIPHYFALRFSQVEIPV